MQVVKINAELLHFHSIPLAPESTIGGIDLIGAKSATQASVRNATMSKGLFIAILPRCVQIRCFFDPRYRCYQALVSICLREQGKWLRQWANCFMVAWPTKPLHKIATAIRDAGWRALRAQHRGSAFNGARNPRAACLTYRCTALVTRCPLQFQWQKRSNVLFLRARRGS